MSGVLNTWSMVADVPGGGGMPASSRAHPLSVRCSAPRRNTRRMPYGGRRPRCPQVCCWTRRRTSSTAASANRATGKASSTRTALGSPAKGRSVAAERIQRRHLDPLDPAGWLLKKPVSQHFSAVPVDDVDELATSQVDDAGGGRSSSEWGWTAKTRSRQPPRHERRR